jgi:hypothetical protein
MNECLRGGPSWPLHRDPQRSIVLPLLIIHSAILRFEWSVGFCMWGHWNSHLAPQNADPSDAVSNKPRPHTHTGYVWLPRPLPDTSHKWNYRPVPVWTGVLWGDSTLQAVLPPIPIGEGHIHMGKGKTCLQHAQHCWQTLFCVPFKIPWGYPNIRRHFFFLKVGKQLITKQ